MGENITKVREMLDRPELLCQLAEECAELGKAALKLRRAITGENPTPYTEAEAWKNFNEEVADVTGVLKALNIPTDDEVIRGIQENKFLRWVRRLERRNVEVSER